MSDDLQRRREQAAEAIGQIEAMDPGADPSALAQAYERALALCPEETAFDRAEKTALALRAAAASGQRDPGRLGRLVLTLCVQDIAGYDAGPAQPGLARAIRDGFPAGLFGDAPDPAVASWAALHLGLPFRGSLDFDAPSTQQLAAACTAFYRLLDGRGQTPDADLAASPYAASMWNLVVEPVALLLSGGGGARLVAQAGRRRSLLLTATWLAAQACAEAFDTAPDDLPDDQRAALLEQGQALCDVNETLLSERIGEPMTNLNMALRALLAVRARLYLTSTRTQGPGAAAMAFDLYAFLDDEAGMEAARQAAVH